MDQAELAKKYPVVYTAEQIRERVAAIGAAVDSWAAAIYTRTGVPVVLVPILRGAMVFYADLIRELRAPTEVVPIRASTYVANAMQHPEVRVGDFELIAAGRSLLLIDDICDSGRTLEALKQYGHDQGALDVRTTVIVRRVLPSAQFVPDWVGFEYSGSEWFVGYGMDDNQSGRHFRDIRLIR